MKDRTNRGFWSRFAGLYDTVIRKDRQAYDEMYALIRARLTHGMHVLELAAGTGLISIAIAGQVKWVEATDFSPRMIAEAKKKAVPPNVNFSVQDACNLPYADGRFDCVIISNALHIMPDPESALRNISRVLKEDGVLIAPTFTHANNDSKGKLQARLMELFGFKTYHRWTPEAYCAFLAGNGFSVERVEVLQASFPLTYAEARKV